jgi:hypothetical protein
LLCLGCRKPPQQKADAAPVPAAGQTQMAPQKGPIERIEGVARNAKLAAALVAGERVIYCLERESWPEDIDGKRVVVQGVVESTDEFQAKRSPSGEISQGTEGSVLVIRKLVSLEVLK